MNWNDDHYRNPIAELYQADSGKVVKAYEANYGIKYFCPDPLCKDPLRRLFFKRSRLGNAYFSHTPGYGHDIHPETLFHKLAIKWYEGKTSIILPLVNKRAGHINSLTLHIDPSKTQLEYRQLKSVIPDVKVETFDGRTAAIEIIVTNDISTKKSLKLLDHKLPTLKIDLSTFYSKHREECQNIDFIEQHLDKLLQDLKLMEWVNWETATSQFDNKTAIEDNDSPDQNWFDWVALLIIGIIGLFILFRKPSKKRYSF